MATVSLTWITFHKLLFVSDDVNDNPQPASRIGKVVGVIIIAGIVDSEDIA